MYTIKENTTYQYEIKKSKFITILYKVNDLEEIEKYLLENQKKYQDATHCCYAYKMGNVQKFNDDGEPGGTAGLPIMEVINKKNLDYVLCIVIRYFGGIKLGAGGLVRAYSKAVRDAIDNNEIIELTEGYEIKLEVSYEEQKQLDYVLSNNIIKKEFNEKVTYYIEIKKEDITNLQNYNYEIIKEKWIERFK